MPNSRRRKFSVRNGITGREPTKPHNDSKSSVTSKVETEMKPLADNTMASKWSSNRMRSVISASGSDPETKSTNSIPVAAVKSSKSKNKIDTDSCTNPNGTHSVSVCESSTSLATVKNRSNTTVDKDVTASSSNIDLFNLMYTSEDLAEPWKEDRDTVDKNETHSNRTRQAARDKTPLKREKYLRQHRMKVRSPKHRSGIRISDAQNKTNDLDKLTFSVGTEIIDWGRETRESHNNPINLVDVIDDDERQSDNSSDDMCRICHGGDNLSQELGLLISACSCRGTVGRVHVKCLERWLTESGKSRCELCGTRYMTRRVHRYGVPRALIMWILSQNAKQLMVDSLGIMLMSPLAVLAAWLSGRTLAGLMTQEAQATPWPLASTFVLACMTLVCYYCWIVSAATRHALSWWIWYRSQYEVRLQLLETED